MHLKSIQQTAQTLKKTGEGLPTFNGPGGLSRPGLQFDAHRLIRTPRTSETQDHARNGMPWLAVVFELKALERRGMHIAC